MGNISSSSSCGSISSIYSEENNVRSIIENESQSRMLRNGEKLKNRGVNRSNYGNIKTGDGNRGCSVSRVLMVDGQVMELKESMKVGELLSDYGGHVVCPLETLRPGQHALKRLNSEDVLLPGHVYLLLPITSRPRVNTSNSRASVNPVRQPNPKNLNRIDDAHYNIINDNKNKNNGNYDFVDDDYHYRLQLLHKSLYNHNRRSGSAPRGRRSSPSVRSTSIDQLRPTRSSREYSVSRHVLRNSDNYTYYNYDDDDDNNNNVQLRRSRTWTPRLQAIHESSLGNHIITPNHNYHHKLYSMPHVS